MNGYHNGSSALLDAKEETSDMKHHSSSAAKHKHKDKERRKETEEERRIRKEKERREKEKKYRKEGKRPETEEERRIRKEKERKDKEERRKKEGKGREETEEERQLRKEKERKEKEERYRKEGKRPETEEERRARKERERKEREEGKSKHRKESDDERRSRKDKERKAKPDVKVEPTSDDDEENSPLACRPSQSAVQPIKSEPMEEDDEDVPITKSSKRSQKRKSAFDDEDEDEEGHGEDNEDAEYHSDDYAPPSRKKIKEEIDDEEGDDDFKPSKKKSKAVASKKPAAPKKPAAKSKKGGAIKVEPASAPSSPVKGAKKVKKEEQDVKVWKWWEEEKTDDGTKWKFLEHKGPLFAPLYERLPENVRFMYDKQPMRLSDDAEEIATFYGKMLDHDYTTKEVFNKNFFKDWRKSMTDKEREKIRDLSKCDFSEINFYFKQVSEQRKARSKEERKAEKERNDAIQKEYGIAVIDGHEEKIGNFRIEPPGLFRGRGEHPKQGMVKRRVQPEDVTINCSKNSKWPQPPDGHKWKEVRHDNTVTWLASWTENIQNQIKYVMLNPSSRLKGEKDMEKYDKARKLKVKIDKIREDYTNDFKSKEMRVRQRAVALYFIDKLALRAGNEKDEDQADTVGCCSLRIEHITLHPIHEGKEHVVEFDFLGKDSIRYHNYVQVEKRVFKNLQLFKENKKVGDDLFDRLNTSILNDYLSNLMPGLTAKVFRTYNASITLQEQLALLTESDDNIPAKMLSYNRANRAVAVLCNHQRAVPKTHETSMKNLQDKIDKKKQELDEAEKQYKAVKKASKGKNSAGEVEKKMKAVKRIMEQLNRLETQKTDKEENKQIALGTSKLNYLDPRITVAWCKKFGVPIEKVYNKTQREKFRWAIDMTEEDYIF